ncbi:hypothetical protein KSF_107590 [Reticulibacter mediterranei]|uniref:VWA domain-containing protein n=1 Tax=Reticulibacter mediterranei TaxID=2778369 RepID=A0A8J3J366_9CHLR|nr:hypothetical protein KSF_107590 [Reticulibacter mediterranei]
MAALWQAPTFQEAQNSLLTWPPVRQKTCLYPGDNWRSCRYLKDLVEEEVTQDDLLRQGQRWATRWAHLRNAFSEENFASEWHAEEVVEASLSIDETVHGGEEAAADIEGSPSVAQNGEQQRQQQSGQNGGEEQSDQVGNEGANEMKQQRGQGSVESGGEEEHGRVGNEGANGMKQQRGQGSVESSREERGEPQGKVGTSGQNGEGVSFAGDGMSDPIELEKVRGESTMFLAIRQVLYQLADHPDRWRRQNGQRHWDQRRIVKSRFAPHTLLRAKYTYPCSHDNIFLIVDDSGSASVRAGLADQMKSLIAGALGVVRVFAGSEAHPDKEYTIERKPSKFCEDLPWKEAWTQPYVHDFTSSVKGFLAYAKPAPGARLIFWGDAMDMHLRDPERLCILLKRYRPLWLLSHDGRSSYSGYEAPRVMAAGIPIEKNIASGDALLQALRHVQR